MRIRTPRPRHGQVCVCLLCRDPPLDDCTQRDRFGVQLILAVLYFATIALTTRRGALPLLVVATDIVGDGVGFEFGAKRADHAALYLIEIIAASVSQVRVSIMRVQTMRGRPLSLSRFDIPA